LATSRSGNVTALSLLAPAPTASHGCHRTTPKPSNSTLRDPSLRGCRRAWAAYRGPIDRRRAARAEPAHRHAACAVFPACGDERARSRFRGRGWLRSGGACHGWTKPRGLSPAARAASSQALLRREANRSRPARPRPKSPLCCSSHLYQARSEPDDGRVVGGASTCARSGSPGQAHARGAAAPDLPSTGPAGACATQLRHQGDLASRPGRLGGPLRAAADGYWGLRRVERGRPRPGMTTGSINGRLLDRPSCSGGTAAESPGGNSAALGSESSAAGGSTTRG